MERLVQCGNCLTASPEKEWKKVSREFGFEFRKPIEQLFQTDREIICPHCGEVVDGYRIQWEKK